MNAKAYVKYKLRIHIKSLNEIQRNIQNFRSKSSALYFRYYSFLIAF